MTDRTRKRMQLAAKPSTRLNRWRIKRLKKDTVVKSRRMGVTDAEKHTDLG